MGNIGPIRQRFDVLAIPIDRATVPSPEPMPTPYPEPMPEPVPLPDPTPTPQPPTTAWPRRASRSLR